MTGDRLVGSLGNEASPFPLTRKNATPFQKSDPRPGTAMKPRPEPPSGRPSATDDDRVGDNYQNQDPDAPVVQSPGKIAAVLERTQPDPRAWPNAAQQFLSDICYVAQPLVRPAVLPVWRNVIIHTTERILTGPVYGPIPAELIKSHRRVDRSRYAPTRFFPSGLEIPMAVTCAVRQSKPGNSGCATDARSIRG